MNIQFDKIGTKQFFEWFADKFIEIMFPRIKELVEKNMETDKLLTKKELTETILNCGYDTANTFFVNRADFPRIELITAETKSVRYPKKAVEQWIKDNTITK